MKKDKCPHHITKSKTNETGLWCALCGEKIFEEEINRCCLCKNAKKLFTGWICKKKLMVILPNNHVTYKISDGSCFKNSDN